MHPPRATGPFRYEHYDLNPEAGTLTCRYSLGPHHFTEQFTFDAGPDARWWHPSVESAARLVFLLAGVSYYKTGAPPVVDLGDVAASAAERDFLETFLVNGLGEFALRNHLDLRDLEITGRATGTHASFAEPAEAPGRPLVPFGGGIDSIVTAEAVRAAHPDTALFVVSRAGDRFEAIEAAAAVTGLPVVRAGRAIDPQLLRSAELGFFNGHVPVTGILSAVAVMAAGLTGRTAVVMSNEWSASFGNVEVDRAVVNHQWSKSLEFETAFRDLLIQSGPVADYFSLLRPYSELWVARRFAALPQYLPVFRSCNRAFTIDPATRLDHWCGRCDKCCFIDLVLAPFVPAAELAQVFGGHEPLDDPALGDQFRALLGLAGTKPFECVGDVEECRVAAVLAAGRDDRAGTTLLAELAREGEAASPGVDLRTRAKVLFEPMGPHFIPDAYAPRDQLH